MAMTSKHLMSRYWHGEEPLWRAFWLWGVLGSWILAAIFGAAAAAFGVTAALYAITAIVMIVYTVWILGSVWRCAPNVTSPQWTPIARALTVAWALNVLLVGAFLGLDLLAIRAV